MKNQIKGVSKAPGTGVVGVDAIAPQLNKGGQQ